MEYLSDPHAWLFALMIFALRVADMSLDTIRVLFVVRGKKGIVWVLGFFQSLIFVVAISSVLTQIDNILNVLGYATGFATGNLVGMLIEQRLAIGHILVTIISSNRGAIMLKSCVAVATPSLKSPVVARMAQYLNCTPASCAKMSPKLRLLSWKPLLMRF